jgi:imidazolonepropionase-like amidohydrolase
MRARSILAASALALVLYVRGHAARTEVYALVGGRIVTVSGPVLEGGTIVLRDGLIEAVGAGVPAPADARVIDVKGLTVTPGLVDGFGGIGLPAARTGPGGGASPSPAPSALAPQAFALDRIRLADALKARDSGVTTALVIPREGVLPGQSVLVDLGGDKLDAMVLRQPAALHLHLATLARTYPGSLMGTIAYARQALYDAGRYRDEWKSYEAAPRGRKRPRYDAALQAWQDVLAGKELLIVTASRENDVRRALALGDEFKVRLAVAGAPQAFRAAGLVKARKLPLLVGVNFDPPRAAGFGVPDDEKERREIADAEGNPAELHKAGVSFALVSAHAPDFLAGVRKAIERGLPADVALRAVTLAPAEVLGVADRLGSLEAGKIANVVVWTGEPLAKDAKAKMVFVDGQLYEPEDRGDKGKPPSPSPSGSPSPSPAPTGAALGGSPPVSVPAIAIRGGTIITLGPPGTIAGGTVLVRDGRIAAIGRDVAVPAGARIVEAAGRYVIPGIIDAHSHTAVEESVNECSDAITAEVRIADVLDQHDVNIYRELAGGVTTANVLHGSCNPIGGQNAVIKMRWGKRPEELLFEGAPRGIKFALGENVKRSNVRVRGGAPRFPATRMGVEAVIRDAFRRAQDYKREWADYDRKVRAAGARGERPPAPRKDLELDELRDILDGKVYVHAHCYRADEILMLIRLADEFGFKVRTFQHVLEGYKVASEIARHGAGASTFSDWWAYKMEAYDAIPYNAAIMAAHGVTVSLNSDSDELARRLYWEAAKAVKYGGVAEKEALEMVTLNPARQLGIDKRVGSLEVGKDADIAIFSAHPFDPAARVDMTLVDGVVYFDRATDDAKGPTTAGGAR